METTEKEAKPWQKVLFSGVEELSDPWGERERSWSDPLGQRSHTVTDPCTARTGKLVCIPCSQ